MFIFKKALPRRAVLRGLGATVALPFLDAMVPATANAKAVTNPPKRFAAVFVPLGFIARSRSLPSPSSCASAAT